MTSLGVIETVELDSSEDEWVITSNPSTPTKKPLPPKQRPSISAASIRTIRTNLPKPLRPPATPNRKLHGANYMSPLTPATPTPLTPPASSSPAVSMQYISDTELQVICSEMDAQLLVTRLVQVYKSCEIYIRIREIETTNSQIEMRLKDHLHYCSDPPDFILVYLYLYTYILVPSRFKTTDIVLVRIRWHHCLTTLMITRKTKI
jgi:hypothetical protein